jgi:tuberculosinol/isotuberculosinol synthase
MVSFHEFLDLPTEEIAELVRASGPQVCVFPINGTRRWYLLESGDDVNYLKMTADQNIKVYKMIFDYGIQTLLAPVFGSDLIARGLEYTEMAVEGLTWLATAPIFLDFYREYGVRVRFYGDYRKQLAATPYADLPDMFDRITLQTKDNTRHLLCFGVFANSAIETVAEFSARHYREYGTAPNERQIIEMYYGEYIGPVSLFIGFDKFWVFDMPLLATENTDIYFTVNPSLYLNDQQLRSILFDHLYSRWLPEPDYETLPTQAKNRMKAFYSTNADHVLGVGVLSDGIWYPFPPDGDLPDPTKEGNGNGPT